MKEVHSLEQAMKWFLENHSGNVVCVKGKEKLEVDSYHSATQFYLKR